MLFVFYAENATGVNGMGDTIQDAKNSLMESIEIQKELGNLKPGNYEVVYRFDTKNLLHYYQRYFYKSSL